MGVIGKAALMVIAALALLLGLGFADPSKSRLMPSFFSADPPPGVVPRGAIDEGAIVSTIAHFNRDLSSAYLALNPAALAAVPMDEKLRRDFVEELAFLRKGGRALDVTVRDIRISQVRRLENLMLSVDTVESVRIRYLNASDGVEVRAYPEARYAMNYTLEESGSRWKIVAVETMEVGKRDR